MYIIVGLGNPGDKYEDTRHNVGFKTIDSLSREMNIPVNKLKWKSLYGEGNYRGKKVILMKPQTFMNLSGEAVREAYNFFNIPAENLIVITDDIDIKWGSVRIKAKGSAGSHNGLKSIIKLIGSQDFPRVKIAVGQKPDYMDLANFVLSRFSKQEKPIVEKEIELAKDGIIQIIEDGIDNAMNSVNSQSVL